MRKIGYILLLASLVFVGACSQDQGNYDYIDLDEPAISGIEDMEVFTLSRLQLTPQIEGGDFSSDKYAYEWMVLNQNTADEPVIIGTERNLD